MIEPVLNVALIGYGHAGKIFHAPIISNAPGMRLAMVISSDPSKVNADYPDVLVRPRPEDAFEDSSIDLIVIATPNLTHFDLAGRALQAGKHVVVDKPFTVNSRDAMELIKLADKHKRVISVYQNRRYDSDFQTLKKIIDDKLLGRITQFQANFDRYRPQVVQRWREQDEPGGGLWYDLGSHLTDQALVLFGEPDAIYADLAVQRDGARAADYFHVVLRYDRTRVILHGSTLVSADLPRFVVHGTEGSYVKYWNDVQPNALNNRQKPVGEDWGLDPLEGTLHRWENGTKVVSAVPNLRASYVDYYSQVRAAIVENAPNPVQPADAIALIRLLELGVESSKEGRELPFEHPLKLNSGVR
jgi:scyllo-inositol 2-dehydrogenase (NADP+)